MAYSSTSCAAACNVPNGSRTTARGFIARLINHHEAWRQRQALKRLDDSALCDIGLTRGDAVREARQGIWNAPRVWHD